MSAPTDPEYIANTILPEIQKIRDNIPALFALASAEDGVDLTSYDRLNLGTLRTEYLSVLSYLSNPDNDETSSMVTRRTELEDIFVSEAASLSATSPPISEVLALLDLFKTQVNLWTRKNGIIEEQLRSEGQEDAQACYDQLISSLTVYEILAAPFLKGDGKDSHIYEMMAEIKYKAYFDGQRSLDRPAAGLKSLSEIVLPEYEENQNVQQLLAALEQEAVANGIESELFFIDAETGEHTLRSDFDLSDSSQGIAAAQLTRSAYIMPGGWRGFLVPLAGAGAGYTIGSMGLPALAGVGTGAGIGVPAVLSNPPGLVVAGLTVLGTGAAIYADYYYDTRIRGAEAYAQVAKSGLSRITEEEAHNSNNGYYLYGGITLATSAAIPFAKPAAGFLRGGAEIALAGGRGLVQLPKAAYVTVAEQGFYQALITGGRATGRQVALHAGLAGQGVRAMSWPT